MVTIKDIAKLANVSIGTVDRVIHNRGGVSDKTRENIQQILKDNNFKINAIARSLALKKTTNIAVLMPEFDSRNLFWKAPFMGVSKAANEVENLGIKVHTYVFNQFDNISFFNQFEKIIDEGYKVDAFIFTPIFNAETAVIIKYLEENSIPYMFLNMDIEGYNNISYIGQNAFKGGYLCGKLMQLCTTSNSTILIVNFEYQAENNSLVHKRIEGFVHYLEVNNPQSNAKVMRISESNRSEMIKNQLLEVLDSTKNIQGIFVPSSRVSIISECLDGSKYSYLKLIGFDTTEQNITCLKEDKVTFLISQKSFNQGLQAIHIMANYLIQNEIPAKKIFSPIEIITKENLEFSQRTKWEYNLTHQQKE